MIQTFVERFTTSPTTSQSAAQQVADTYLQTAVATGLTTTSHLLLPSDPPRWRMIVRLSHQGASATVGTIDVDANTGEVTPLTQQQLHTLRKCVQDAATRSAPQIPE